MSQFSRVLIGAVAGPALTLLATAASAQDAPKIGVDLTTLTSPFWTSYNRYIVDEAKAQGIDFLEPFNSEFDTAKQITGVKNAINARRTGHYLFALSIPRRRRPSSKHRRQGKRSDVAVDVAPDTGRSAIVVRANNIAYGEKACKYIGDHVAGRPVVQIMGDQASINGRDRGTGFRDCITKNFPKLKLLEIPNEGVVRRRRRGRTRDMVLNATPDLKAIYMHAGGVFLAPDPADAETPRPAPSRGRGRPHHHRQQ